MFLGFAGLRLRDFKFGLIPAKCVQYFLWRRAGGWGSTAKVRYGWKGSDGVADMLDHGQSLSGMLPQPRELRKERGSREERTSRACCGETWHG